MITSERHGDTQGRHMHALCVGAQTREGREHKSSTPPCAVQLGGTTRPQRAQRETKRTLRPQHRSAQGPQRGATTAQLVKIPHTIFTNVYCCNTTQLSSQQTAASATIGFNTSNSFLLSAKNLHSCWSCPAHVHITRETLVWVERRCARRA